MSEKARADLVNEAKKLHMTIQEMMKSYCPVSIMDWQVAVEISSKFQKEQLSLIHRNLLLWAIKTGNDIGVPYIKNRPAKRPKYSDFRKFRQFLTGHDGNTQLSNEKHRANILEWSAKLDEGQEKYFVNVGCASVFCQYITKDFLEEAENFFSVLIMAGLSDFVQGLISNFLLHGMQFMVTLRDRYLIYASDKDEEAFGKAFIESLTSLTKYHVRVLKACWNKDKEMTLQLISEYFARDVKLIWNEEFDIRKSLDYIKENMQNMNDVWSQCVDLKREIEQMDGLDLFVSEGDWEFVKTEGKDPIIVEKCTTLCIMKLCSAMTKKPTIAIDIENSALEARWKQFEFECNEACIQPFYKLPDPTNSTHKNDITEFTVYALNRILQGLVEAEQYQSTIRSQMSNNILLDDGLAESVNETMLLSITYANYHPLCSFSGANVGDFKHCVKLYEAAVRALFKRIHERLANEHLRIVFGQLSAAEHDKQVKELNTKLDAKVLDLPMKDEFVGIILEIQQKLTEGCTREAIGVMYSMYHRQVALLQAYLYGQTVLMMNKLKPLDKGAIWVTANKMKLKDATDFLVECGRVTQVIRFLLDKICAGNVIQLGNAAHEMIYLYNVMKKLVDQFSELPGTAMPSDEDRQYIFQTMFSGPAAQERFVVIMKHLDALFKIEDFSKSIKILFDLHSFKKIKEWVKEKPSE